MNFIRIVKRKVNGLQCVPAIFAGAALFVLTQGVHATEFYVDGSVTSSGNGLTWATAKQTVQEGIDAASATDEVWVAAGTYTASTTFTLKSGVNLHGGFAGTETLRTQADPYANATILTGSGTIVTATNTTAALTRLDGFIIRDGARGLSVVNSSDPTPTTTRLNVTRCRFIENDNQTSSGGAVALIKSSPFAQAELIVAFTNCEFIDNSADGNGGAIFVQENVTATITNSLFVGNSADGDGAAISKTNARIINCEFRGNRTPTAGEQPVPRQ